MKGWRFHLRSHPDRTFANTIVGVITCGAKIEYIGPSHLLLSPNHPSASEAPDVLSNDLTKQMNAHRITRVTGTPTTHFVSSSLGLVPKSDGGWRRIHDLSYPRSKYQPSISVNAYIPEEWGTLKYATFDEAVDALIQQGRYAVLVKRDLTDAFRHIPVGETDWWLLGFF